MVHNPSVLILDEPAAGLDPRARIELRQMIRELADGGTTILVSSHILTELAEMCDRVGIIEQGRLLAVGAVEEIQRGHMSHSEMEIRLLENMSKMQQWLNARTDVENIVIDGELVRFSFLGDSPKQAELLREMIGAGFSVASFGCHVKSLEDVFMHVTQGFVQ